MYMCMCTCDHPIHVHVYVYMWPSNTCTCVCVHCLGAGGRLGVSSSLAAYVRKTAAVEVCGGGGPKGSPTEVCQGMWWRVVDPPRCVVGWGHVLVSALGTCSAKVF